MESKSNTIITDQHITAETDELDPSFYEQSPPLDPEDEDDEQEDDDDFPTEEDLVEDDFDLNGDDDLGLEEDDEEFK